MFKTVFSKLLTGFVAILVFTLILVSLFSTSLYRKDVFEQKEISLENGAKEVEFQLQLYYDGYAQSAETENAIDTIGAINDSRIYAIEINYNDLISAREGRPASDDSLYDDLISIMEGNTVFSTKNYSADIDTYTIFYGRPLTLDKDIIGAIIQYSPLQSIQKSILEMNLKIFGIGLMVLFIGVGLIYYFARRITAPLKDIEKAATALATGDKVDDIKVFGDDEIAKLSESFNHMKNQLAHIESLRMDYLAGISHELRTPLTSILGFVQGIKDGIVPPEDMDSTLDIVQDETRRMIDMTSEILSLAKLENMSESSNPESIHVIEALTFIIGTMHVNEKKPDISIEMVCPGDISVWSDADRFKQIMINLLSNAIKYTNSPGNITVEVSKTQSDYILFVVSDTGEGIEEKDLNLVFERFYRTDKSRHSSTGGTGLGLNIVKTMVEQYGGSIWVESTVGVGSSFYFTLPSTKQAFQRATLKKNK